MKNGLMPFWEQLAISILAPPIIAAAWWLLSRRLAAIAHRGVVSARTRDRQKLGFWGLLIAMYTTTLAMMLYSLLRR